ncbi:MAG: acyltransferase family protein [Sneathiella sp.]
MTVQNIGNVHLNSGFRKDINILRAVAVLSVIFFHFGFGFARGGYLGVDIFFVISGYLMTAIITSRLETKTFSLFGFYMSRFLRIAPALAGLCIISLIVGWFVIFPYDYAYLGRNVNHALMFKSNISFASGDGYFDTGTDIKWLLHTWSLSVEMQFYLIYPFLLIILHKLLGLRYLRFVLAGAALLSFAAYIWTTMYGDPNHAFYLLPFRAWELLAGGLVVVFPIYASSDKSTQNKLIGYLRYAGVALIAIPVIIGSGGTELAILWAALASMGTILVLATPNNEIKGTAPGLKQFSIFVHYTGLISYSLYLWHWPIRSLQQYLGYEDDLMITFGALGVTYIFAAISYTLIETKARVRLEPGHFLNRKTALAFAILIVPILLPYSAAKYVRSQDGIVQRLDSLPYDNMPTYLYKDPELYLLEGITSKCQNNGTGCQLTNGTRIKSQKDWKPDVILIGDSHAMSTAHALSETPIENRFLKVLLTASAGCLYIKDLDQTGAGSRKYERCKSAYQTSMSVLEKFPSDIPVFIVNNFPSYLRAKQWEQIQYQRSGEPQPTVVPLSKTWLNLVCKVSAERDTYIMRSVPKFAEPVVRKIVQNVLRGTTDTLTQKSFAISTAKHSQNTKDERAMLNAAQEQCGAKLIDPASAFCSDGFCYGASSRIQPYYRDEDHLNLFGARKLIPLFAQSFAK